MCGRNIVFICILGWNRFEGISWSADESAIAYVAEEPSVQKPSFSDTAGYKNNVGSNSTDKDFSSWKGQGDWEEDWGEAYSGKRQPALFVIDINRLGLLPSFFMMRIFGI